MRDINEEIERARAQSLAPCGTSCTATGSSGFVDEQGHRVGLVHIEPAQQNAAAVRAVAALHRPDPEGFVPMCSECGKAAPCPTLLAVGGE